MSSGDCHGRWQLVVEFGQVQGVRRKAICVGVQPRLPFVCLPQPTNRPGPGSKKNTGPALGIRPNWLLGAGVVDFIEMSDVAVFPAADTTDVLAAVF